MSVTVKDFKISMAMFSRLVDHFDYIIIALDAIREANLALNLVESRLL